MNSGTGSITELIKGLIQPPIKKWRLLIKWTRLLQIKERIKEDNIIVCTIVNDVGLYFPHLFNSGIQCHRVL